MTDIYARVRQLIGTTAEWAANDLVIGNGELAVERVSASEIKIKIGDGVSPFSTLPYVAGGTTGAAAGSLPLAGGTLTGPLILPAGAPTGLQALAKDEADKLYVLVANLLAASVGAASAGKVPKLNAAGKLDPSFLSISGGMNFKGSTDPTVATPPAAAAAGDFFFASKNATLAAGWTGLVGAAIKAGDSLLFDGVNWHSLSGVADLSGYLLITGGTMTGALNVPATPVNATEATSKGYVDIELAKKAPLVHTHATYVPLAGGSMTGPLVLAAAPTTGLGAATKDYVDARNDGTKVNVSDTVTTGGTAAQSGKIPKLDASGKISTTMLPASTVGAMTFKGGAPVNVAPPAGATIGDYYVSTTAGSMAAGWDGIVGQTAKIGDSLIFDGAKWHIIPAESDLNSYLPLAGGTMTGPIVLSGAPTADGQAANKKYVDDRLVAASGGTGAAVPLAGGTMTGLLVLSGAPTADLNATTKKYVDDHDALKVDTSLLVASGGTAADANHIVKLDATGRLPLTALPVTGAMIFKGSISVTAAPPTASSGFYYIAGAAGTAVAGWTGISGQAIKAGDALVYDGTNWHAIAQEIDLTAYLKLTGGTMTGPIVLSAAPTADGQAANKKYVDDQDAAISTVANAALPKAGGTMTGPIVLPAAPAVANQAIGFTQAAKLFNNRKNAIINGDFQIWQEGTSFAAIANGAYTADNWQYEKAGAMVHTASQSSDVPTIAEAGRKIPYSILLDCTTVDASIAAGDFCVIGAHVEGYNFVHIAGVGLCFQFWCKHTKIGTYCVSFRNVGLNRAFIREYTQNVSDTWELKFVLIDASPSAGTWNYTTGLGISVNFILACGSALQTTAGAWQTGNFLGTSNQVNACDSTSNNFRLAGVQLEKGSVATGFDVRTFTDELLLCQRYFQKSFTYETAPSQGAGLGTGELYGVAGVAGANNSFLFTRLPVAMRATPTAVTFNPATTDAQVTDESGSLACTSTSAKPRTDSLVVACAGNAGTSAGNLLGVHYTLSARF